MRRRDMDPKQVLSPSVGFSGGGLGRDKSRPYVGNFYSIMLCSATEVDGDGGLVFAHFAKAFDHFPALDFRVEIPRKL